MKRILTAALMLIAPLAFAQDAMQMKIDAMRSSLGGTIGEERTTSGRMVEFETGAIYWSSRTDARYVATGTLRKYRELGGASGRLGYPVTDTRTYEDGSTQQVFEHGFIVSASSGAITTQIIDGVQFTENALTVLTPDLIGFAFDNNGLFVIRGAEGDVVPAGGLSCNCEKKPLPYSTRMGFCNVVLSEDRKTAMCVPYRCDGSCAFSMDN